MSRRSEKVEVMIPFVLGVGIVHLLAILFFGTGISVVSVLIAGVLYSLI